MDEMTNPLPFGWQEHAFRSTIHGETHARPSAPIDGAATVRRVAFSSRDRGKDLQIVAEQIRMLAGGEVGGSARQLSFVRSSYVVTLELHNEFATLTWRAPAGDDVIWPEDIGLEALAPLDFFAAMRVEVVLAPTVPAERISQLAAASFCHSGLYDGQVEVATNFIADSDGYVTFLLAASQCGAQRRGVIVRRLLEIETYRSLALLGLPIARQVGGRVQAQEHDLERITAQIGDPSFIHAQRRALDDLHRLSVEAGRLVEETGFRFSATQAYGDILANRLERLGERPLGESTTITRYLDNRIRPALATCRAMEKRLTDLGGRVQRSIELLNATMSVAIQSQNQEVLDTILSTAQSQYRLQETVEGLSIIAITYYGLGILSYLLEGMHDALPISKPVLLSVAAPVIAIMVFFVVRRLRRHKGAS